MSVTSSAAAEGDLLDLAIAHVAQQARHVRRAARQPEVVDDDVVFEEADDDASARLEHAACSTPCRPAAVRCTSGCVGAYSSAARTVAPRRRIRSSKAALMRLPGRLARHPLQEEVAGRAPARRSPASAFARADLARAPAGTPGAVCVVLPQASHRLLSAPAPRSAAARDRRACAASAASVSSTSG